MNKKVVIGMSGGVDSSVAAYMLKQQGYDVIGVIMQIWQDEERCDIEENGGCCGYSAVNDARKVADKLDIPFYVLNFKQEFKNKVIDYFIDEYYLGRTPNPCIACNRYVKWESLLTKAMSFGADYIATGHYAKINRLDNGRYAIQMDFNNPKDQSYALFNLTQKQLEHTLMPIWGMSKDEVRRLAGELGLNTANKPDSQEICFIADNDYGAYISKNGGKPIIPGDFVDEDGNVLAKHKGIIYYTVGQRKGLGIAFGKPMFVKSINPATNQVILCEGDKVFSQTLTACDINLMGETEFANREALVKIRYSHKPAKCKFTYENGKIECEFDTPQRAVTPGQAAVFYDFNGNILCGGTIEK
ncbi:tRNA 2-thiouridine(34) synthase MnmA [Tyzzerella sp. OttesenSCG-928-J15]|nr:tRNA 2-thiouridine(34) synthase MnmA [Tyzzerella sp. OttesenSCG-928-J15]